MVGGGRSCDRGGGFEGAVVGAAGEVGREDGEAVAAGVADDDGGGVEAAGLGIEPGAGYLQYDRAAVYGQIMSGGDHAGKGRTGHPPG